jgi:hypothetical protein
MNTYSSLFLPVGFLNAIRWQALVGLGQEGSSWVELKEVEKIWLFPYCFNVQ